MQNLSLKILNEEPKNGEPGAGAPPKPQGEQPPASNPPGSPPPQTEGDKFDEFGYEKKEGAPGKDGDQQPKPAAKEPPKKVETPATGYDKDIKVEEEPPAVLPKEGEKPPGEPPPPEEFDIKAEGISEAEIKEIKAFAKKHSLTKEAAQDLADTAKANIAQIASEREENQKKIERKKREVQAGWQKELREDPNFGGEKYANNVQNAERVLEEFMGEVKKDLTANKVMPSPSFMRGLARLAEVLYETPSFVGGEPIKPKPPEPEEDDGTAFYKN